MVTAGLSFCIPVFGTADYVGKLLWSIMEQRGAPPFEILVGCDGDPKALSILKALKPLYTTMRLFYDPVNRGKFITENTLASLSSYDRLVFIDSDDHLSGPDVIGTVIDKYHNHDIIALSFINRVQHGFSRMKHEDGQIRRLAGGNFIIKRDVFLAMNGFYPWRCRADGPFHTRAGRLGYSSVITEEPVIERVMRPDSLLYCQEYGEGSEKRRNYKHLSARMVKDGIYRPDRLYTNPDLKEV